MPSPRTLVSVALGAYRGDIDGPDSVQLVIPRFPQRIDGEPGLDMLGARVTPIAYSGTTEGQALLGIKVDTANGNTLNAYGDGDEYVKVEWVGKSLPVKVRKAVNAMLKRTGRPTHKAVKCEALMHPRTGFLSVKHP